MDSRKHCRQRSQSGRIVPVWDLTMVMMVRWASEKHSQRQDGGHESKRCMRCRAQCWLQSWCSKSSRRDDIDGTIGIGWPRLEQATCAAVADLCCVKYVNCFCGTLWHRPTQHQAEWSEGACWRCTCSDPLLTTCWLCADYSQTSCRHVACVSSLDQSVFMTPCDISCAHPFHDESRKHLSSIQCNSMDLFPLLCFRQFTSSVVAEFTSPLPLLLLLNSWRHWGLSLSSR